MRKTSILLIVALLCGCTVTDNNPDARPAEEYPSWAFDAPFYYRPTVEPAPVEMIGPGIPIYFGREDVFFVRHPAGSQITGEPRIAVWTSLDEGMTWERSGYFGLEQTHFVHKATQDGPHWVRFVGPSQSVAQLPPAQPHRIYVVDRCPPEITVTVDPPPVPEDPNEPPHEYCVGDEVRVSWQVTDDNVQADSIRMSTAFAKFPNNVVWGQLPEDLPLAGSETITLPIEAATEGGMRFRVIAADKAGNVSVGLSDTVVVKVPEGQEYPTTQPAGLIVFDAAQDSNKPGWPMQGSLLRGGTIKTIDWMPRIARDYEVLELHFSANSGLTWQTVATGLAPGQLVTWAIPSVNSPNCLLRFAGIDETGSKVMLVTSKKFRVDTVSKDVILGPAPIRQGE